MFDGGFSSTDLAADLPLFDALSALAVRENKCEFEKIMLAAELWEAWFERDARSGGDVITDCGNNAIAEMALRLGCSRTMVENFAMLGIDLRLRLPLTRAAFSAGQLDYPRAAKISRLTTGFTQKTVELAESGIVAAAETLSPGPLGSAIDRILVSIAPDEVAERRVDATAFRKLRKRRDNDLGIFEAALAPDECEATWQRIAEVAATVCTHDRRNKQYRLVDAFMALIHGEGRLQCRCERADCTAAKTPSSKRRTPLVQVSIDVATLLGLLSNPGYLEGYGPIDPAFARELAADGTWQSMLTEALDMAESLGLVEDEAAVPVPAAQPPPRTCIALPRGRGKRRKAGWLPDSGTTSSSKPATPPVHAVAQQVAAAIATNPRLAEGEHPDGHAGFAQPPPGALDYTPDAETTAIVRARDRHCRFPGCRVPAKRCQLDHVVPFRHHSPRSGGWTVPSNLQCVCAFHHQLKTQKLWSARMLPGGFVVWVNSYGTSHITVPDAGLTAIPPAPDLLPRVGAGPEKWRPPEADDDVPPF